MLGHLLFHPGPADILAAANDEIVEPTAHDEVALGIDAHLVAQHHPAVGPDELGVGGDHRWIVSVIAPGKGRALATRAPLAGFADIVAGLVEEAHVHRGNRSPRGAQAFFPAVFEGGSADGPGFVGAVELQHPGPGSVLESGGALVGDRLAPGEEDAQRVEVVAAVLGGLEHHDELGRDRGENAHPMPLDEGEGLPGIETRHHATGCAQQGRSEMAGPDPEPERGGHHAHEDIAARELPRLYGQGVKGLPARLVVGHAFGHARRARR